MSYFISCFTYAIKIHMKSTTKMRIVAIIICAIVYAIYIAIVAEDYMV